MNAAWLPLAKWVVWKKRIEIKIVLKLYQKEEKVNNSKKKTKQINVNNSIKPFIFYQKKR